MLNKLMKLKNKKGFTLVELIVVIAIIAILTAIIVPLVGRYSAQARYTTLNDAASTISSSANTALSDANQIAALTKGHFTGSKTGSTLTVVFTPDGTGTATTVNSEATATTASNDTAAQRATKRLYSALVNALPAGDSTFYVDVTSASVKGVVYSTDVSSHDVSKNAPATTDFGTAEGFDNAYEFKADHVAVGLSGEYIPVAPSAPAPSTPKES